MKKNTHPDYHNVTIKMTDGTTFETKSTWGKEGSVMTLDIDVLTHPVWTGVQRNLDTKGKLSKFNSKYGAFGINKKRFANKEQ